MLMDQGLLQAAKECHEKCKELDSSRPEPWLGIGEVLRAEGFLDQAEENLRESLRKAPTWHLAHFNLANILKSQDRHEEAIQEYKTSLKFNPPFKAAVYNNMALSYGAINRNDDVLRCYEDVHAPSLPFTPHLNPQPQT